MLEFNKVYQPLTANPFRYSKTYVEIEPCDLLKPYIRCFWGSPKSYTNKQVDKNEIGIVTPDTCMDIIFHINYTQNRIDNIFCAINDSSFQTSSGKETSIVSEFAIRFYAWSVVLFSEESMEGVKNNSYDVGQYFGKLKSQIEPLLFDVENLADKVHIVQNYLIKRLYLNRENPIVMNAVYQILCHKGNIMTKALANELIVSKRQLERLFNEYIGVSPKQLSLLIRYQYLWKDVLFIKKFNIQDAVYKYGYFDQSHLINDFKKYHSLTPKEAKLFAKKDVAFLQ